MTDLNKDGIIDVRDVTELQKKLFQNKNILSAFYRIIDITKIPTCIKIASRYLVS